MCQLCRIGRRPWNVAIAAAAASRALMARLDPIEQRRADAAPTLLGMDDAPGPDDVRLPVSRLPVRDDRSCVIGHDPCVGGEIEIRPAPHLTEEEFVERRLYSIRQLVVDEHAGHRVDVVPRRRPKPVSGREVHAERVRVPRQPDRASASCGIPWLAGH
jgi:hypothetical protein